MDFESLTSLLNEDLKIFTVTKSLSVVGYTKTPEIFKKYKHYHLKKHVPQAVLRLFGVTQNFGSVCCNVYGLKTILTTEIFETQQIDLMDIQFLLNQIVSQSYFDGIYRLDTNSKMYLDSGGPVVTKLSQNKDTHYHSGNFPSENICDVRIGLPKFAHAVVKTIETGFSIFQNGKRIFIQGKVLNQRSPIDFLDLKHTRQIDVLDKKNCKNYVWILLKKNTFLLRDQSCTKYLETTCNIEIEIHQRNVCVCPVNSEVPPLRILSLDIEVDPGSRFPFPGENSVLQIGNIMSTLGHKESTIKTIFTIGKCHPIPQVQIISSENEEKMLRNWHRYLTQQDPDIVTGYNILGFDLPYLMERCLLLEKPELRCIGRVKYFQPYIRNKLFNPGVHFTMSHTEIIGRLIFDVYPLIKEFNHGVSNNNSLENNSLIYLGKGKISIDMTKLKVLNETQEGRTLLARYCLTDAQLALELLFKLFSNICYPKH